MSLRLGSLEKQIGKVERAAGLGPCAMCELFKAHTRRVNALIAEVAATRPEETPREQASYTSRSFCAWCGRVEVREYRATEGAASNLEIIWRGLEAGRACAPEVAAALERNEAEIRAFFGERVAEYEAMYSDFLADVRALPPPRFPYVCTIADCPCRHTKRDAA